MSITKKIKNIFEKSQDIKGLPKYFIYFFFLIFALQLAILIILIKKS
jgi:hypothetical protein